jgi:hypothetical protein
LKRLQSKGLRSSVQLRLRKNLIISRKEANKLFNNWPRNPRPNKSLLNKLSRLLNPLSYLKNQKQIPIAYYSRR